MNTNNQRMKLDEAQDVIDEMLQLRGDELNAWENDFCESIYYSTYRTLTEKQTACLNKIWDRVMQ